MNEEEEEDNHYHNEDDMHPDHHHHSFSYNKEHNPFEYSDVQSMDDIDPNRVALFKLGNGHTIVAECLDIDRETDAYTIRFPVRAVTYAKNSADIELFYYPWMIGAATNVMRIYGWDIIAIARANSSTINSYLQIILESIIKDVIGNGFSFVDDVSIGQENQSLETLEQVLQRQKRMNN